MTANQHSVPFRRGFVPQMLVLWIGLAASGVCPAAEFYVGAASESITPDRPVALAGQMRTRIAKDVDSPVMAVALALESRDGEKPLDQAILVACDLVAIREGILERVRQRLAPELKDFDPAKLVLSATHTHTAPVTEERQYEIPAQGVVQPGEYVELLVERVAKAAAAAWNSRTAGRAAWGLGHAVVAQNRRATYADGTAAMYGRSSRPEFGGFEGQEDHGVEVLYFWNVDNKLIATAINLACPAQEVEGKSTVNADFWHEVRTMLAQRHGHDLHVLGWTGAAGDQSPHLQYQQRAEERMRQLRGLTRLEELARRIVDAWQDTLTLAAKDIRNELALKHTVQQIELPLRQVTREEYLQAQTKVRELAADPAQKPRVDWHQRVVERFEKQSANESKPCRMELHAIRLGEIAITTNRFELFTDYGIQIKARGPALQTFVIQLAGPGSYLPTERAVRGGGYSAIVESNLVGPQGGQVLVDRTVAALEALWQGN